MENKLMKCGHVANAIYEGKICCAICAPKKEAFEEVEELPSEKGRKARCFLCNKEVDSNWDLPFFEYKPNSKFDEYYCGCRGWD